MPQKKKRGMSERTVPLPQVPAEPVTHSAITMSIVYASDIKKTSEICKFFSLEPQISLPLRPQAHDPLAMRFYRVVIIEHGVVFCRQEQVDKVVVVPARLVP